MAKKIKVSVDYENDTVDVTLISYEKLIVSLEKKLGISFAEHKLKYLKKSNNKWISITEDEDLEDITEETQLRIFKNPGKHTTFVK